MVNRLDPLLFGSCFESWIKELWPGRHDLIAIDSKTSRRTHDKRKGLKALHTLSAYATDARLVLGQLSAPEKTNEITAIPELLDHSAEAKQLEGALVNIDAVGGQVAIADKIVEHKADYLLALKGNQPTLEAEVADYFNSVPAKELLVKDAEIEFKDDLSRYRSDHGAKNMAIVRRFALHLVRANKSKRCVKTRRKLASWDTAYFLERSNCCSLNER